MRITTIKWLDNVVGGLICWLLIPAFREKPKEEKSVLVIQLWSIGETILTLPAMKSIKEKYGQVKVLCTKNNKSIFESVDFVDELFILDNFLKDIPQFIFSHFRSFDLVFDFEEYLNISAIISYFVGKFRTGFVTDIKKERDHTYNEKVEYHDCQHVVQSFCDQIGMLAPKELIKLKGESTDFLEKNNIKEFVGLCVTSSGTSENNRRWPYFKELIKRIKDDVVIIAGPDEDVKEFLVRDGVFVCDLPIKPTISVIEKAKMFISNDTGPMHIAAAQGVRTIGIFGANLPLRFGPYGKNNIALYHHLPCSPCINVHSRKLPECNDAKCIRSITLKEVMDSF